MDGERIVFTEESNPRNYLKLIASGDVDETMLEALEDYVKRQKKRLAPRRRHGLDTRSISTTNERGRQLGRPHVISRAAAQCPALED
jgi:hypothetical protein